MAKYKNILSWVSHNLLSALDTRVRITEIKEGRIPVSRPKCTQAKAYLKTIVRLRNQKRKTELFFAFLHHSVIERIRCVAR